MKRSFYIALFSALLTAGLIKAAPAVAQPSAGGEVAVSFVRTADLNLDTAGGQRLLNQRLARAAREVCGSTTAVDPAGANDIRKCRDDTIAKVQLQKTAVLAATDRGAAIAVIASR